MDSQNQQTDVFVKMVFFQNNPRIAPSMHRARTPTTADGIHFVRSDDGGNTWPAPIVSFPPDGNSSTDYPFDFALGSQDQGAIFFGQNSGTGTAVCGNPKLSLSTDLTHWSTCAAPTPASRINIRFIPAQSQPPMAAMTSSTFFGGTPATAPPATES